MKTPQVPPVFEAPKIGREPTTWSRERAERAASKLQEGDEDGWSYRAVPDRREGSAYHLIEIRDETGAFVGYF